VSNTCNTNVAQQANIMITLPTGITAFGFDLADTNSGQPLGTQDTYLVTDSNGGSILITPTSFGTYAFVGFNTGSASSFISSVTITRETVSPNGEPAINNFEFGPVTPAAQTPEPSAIVLLGTGLLTIAGGIRRRMRKQ
jgi:hypothetical protein